MIKEFTALASPGVLEASRLETVCLGVDLKFAGIKKSERLGFCYVKAFSEANL